MGTLLIASGLHRHLPRPVRPREDALAFASLCAAYAGTGGLACADRLAMEEMDRQGVRTVARWIVERTVVSLQWQGGYWLPMFQFRRPGLALRVGIAEPLEELRPVLDDWSIASWFSAPNGWLDGVMPCEAVAAAPRKVHEAARALRFVLRG